MIVGDINRPDKNALLRLWVISDLQQSQPEEARRCLTAAVEDFLALGLKCDKIAYLGDSVQGTDLSHLSSMTSMQTEMLGSLDIPLCFVIGNHDLDYYMENRVTSDNPAILPFWDAVRGIPGWKTTDSLEDFYFTEDLGEMTLVFLSDHASPDGRWYTTHGELRGDAEQYPYGKEIWNKLLELITKQQKPVLTLSHYAFPGGNRPSPLFNDMLMPLPSNVILHMYGHAHIGDAFWAGKDHSRKISWIDDHDIPQVNASSL